MNSQDGEFTLKEITVGITTDSNVEVLSGLNEGDTVLIPIAVSSDANRTVTMGGFGGMGGFPGAGAGFISGGNRVFSGGGSGRGAGGTSGGTGGGGR
jgi:HlyD family secretion protein